ncbi:MAG: flagellar biosynthesis regulator FlaF [Acetobacteraceae bacterium]|nr:flagellar biosynthesis regulator FlaF [Acetobacteraceae bacterium]
MPLDETRQHANAAYRQRRTSKQAEAAVFAEANCRLRMAADAGGQAALRALADNRRLWAAILGAVTEPTNALPVPLRAQLASLAHAVLRETDAPEPDINFLIETNEAIAAGLWA